jgi:hypothetical protein
MSECPRCGDNRITEITEATWGCTFCRYLGPPTEFQPTGDECPRCHGANIAHITGATSACYGSSDTWLIGRAE